MTGDENWIVMGRIGGAQGLKGELKVTSFAAGLESWQRLKSVSLGSIAQVRTMQSVRAGPRHMIVKLAGVEDRTQAEALAGLEVLAPRTTLPAIVDPNEAYVADLIGCVVVTPEGESLGVVVDVVNYGASDLLEVATPEGVRALAPFRADVVTKVDIIGRQVVLDPAFLAL